ncbi:MAG: EMC3/TMCO1 family protein [Nitrososphaerota archaeon]|nr:EMC3/TMCO1 family protein [Nitrososphaerota archaeon]
MLPMTPPGSTLFFFSLAAIVTFLMTLANRLFINPEKLKEWRREISDYYRQLREAQKSGDKKQLEKLMKKQQYILQLNAKISWQSTKVMFIFLVPLWIVWVFLGGIYGGADIAFFPGLGWHLHVPLLPWPITSLFWWYMLCSFFFSTLFSHIFGLVSVE